MTGTAVTEAEEFQKIYKLDVIEIPTNKPSKRGDLPVQIDWKRIKDSILVKELTVGIEYDKQKVKLNLRDKLIDANEEKQMY